MPYKYPSDLSSEYYMSLNLQAYVRPDPFKSLVQTIGNQTSGGFIYLPIPANIINKQNLNWQQEDGLAAGMFLAADQMDGASMGAAAQVFGVRNAGTVAEMLTSAGLIRAAGPQIGPMGLPSQSMQNEVARGAAGAGRVVGGAVGQATNGVLQNAGLALNPVLTQMFKNPEFKTHQFSWKFSPNSAAESNELAELIETLERNALPGAINGGAFFTYPSIVNIRIHTGSKDLYAFKPCVINSIEVNHAASGVPSFFAGTKLPTSIQLSISLTEIILNTQKNRTVSGSPLTKNDFSLSGTAFSGVKNFINNFLGNR